MVKRVLVFTAALALALVSAGFSQSLADLAKKEKERRAKMQAEGKIITDANTSKYKGGAVSTAEAPEPATAPPGEDKSSAPSAGGAATGTQKPVDEPTDFEGRPESFWRQTMSDAQARVTGLENQANVLTLTLTDLQNRFYRESDGFKQQQIQRDIQKAIYEQDLNKQELAKARQQLQELETEARKSGALPGWLKPKGE